MARSSGFDRLDPEQRAAVFLDANGAVSAGAGSGKTTVLAARYLRLVLAGAEPRSILCLTFTRKAAAEMRARVYKELLESEESAARLRLENFGEAQISTIDSFCSLLIRGLAQDYGYPPDFSIDDQRSRDLAEREALAFLLERREEGVMPELLARLGFERAWRDLFADVAYRLCSPDEGRGSDFRAMAAAAAGFIEAGVASSLAAAAAALEEASAAAADLARRGKKTAEFLAIEESLRPWLAGAGAGGAAERADPREAARRVEALAAFRLNGFGPSDGAVKEAARSAREAAQRVSDLADAWDLRGLLEGCLAELEAFAARYRAAKRAAGIMGFRDAARCAVDLLARRKEIRAYWKRRFRFVMIDEFQDDDELQRDLLYLLSEADGRLGPGVPEAEELEPGKLFFVGDEKQSIYRFRGAEVSVFNRLKRELPASRGPTSPELPRLRMNYRSEPALVEFFNALFARVFSGAREDFEARFESLGQRPATPGLEPKILYLWKSRRNGDEDGGVQYRSEDEALAAGIARFIAESRGKLLVGGTGGEPPRPADYDDFAILLRSTSKQYIIERFLRLMRIPYASSEQRGLFVESPANDIYAALRLALMEDRLSYATFLRSPFVRLSDDAFVRVMAIEIAGKLPAFSPEGAALLGSDDLARFRRGARVLETVRSRADRDSAAEILSWLWYEAGLRLAILRKSSSHPYLEHYDCLFALAARADAEGKSLSAFVAGLEPLMGRPEKLEDLDVPREELPGVRIMTVHKAKGLEFPIVILPGMESSGRSDGPGRAWYRHAELGVTLNLRPYDLPGSGVKNPFYEGAKALDARKNAAEVKRLFYVACTRAASHLVFAGVEPGPRGARSLSFHSLLTRPPEPGAEESAGAEAAEGSGTPPGSEVAQPVRLGSAGKGAAPRALPAEVRVVEVPDLDEESYLRLFEGTGAVSLDPFLPAYEAARTLDREYPRSSLSVSALEAARLAGTRTADSLAAYPGPGTGPDTGPDTGRIEGRALPACAYDRWADRVEESVFGTLCHAVLEARLARPPRPPRVPARLLDSIPEELAPALLDEALRLALLFLESELGGRALAAPSLGIEKGFVLSLGEGRIAVGRMDLMVELEGRVDIVDFKSDRIRREGEHDLQLALYRKAASALAPESEIRSWLFWLRSGEAEERRAEFTERGISSWFEAAGREP